MIPAREFHKLFPGLREHVGRVNHRQLPGGQALRGDEIQHVEGVLRGVETVLIVAHQGAAGV